MFTFSAGVWSPPLRASLLCRVKCFPVFQRKVACVCLHLSGQGQSRKAKPTRPTRAVLWSTCLTSSPTRTAFPRNCLAATNPKLASAAGLISRGGGRGSTSIHWAAQVKSLCAVVQLVCSHLGRACTTRQGKVALTMPGETKGKGDPAGEAPTSKRGKKSGGKKQDAKATATATAATAVAGGGGSASSPKAKGSSKKGKGSTRAKKAAAKEAAGGEGGDDQARKAVGKEKKQRAESAEEPEEPAEEDEGQEQQQQQQLEAMEEEEDAEEDEEEEEEEEEEEREGEEQAAEEVSEIPRFISCYCWEREGCWLSVSLGAGMGSGSSAQTLTAAGVYRSLTSSRRLSALLG